VDVLLTHATPTDHKPGFGDRTLREATRRVKPKVHVCGHDHAAHGVSYDGNTLVINASLLDETFYYPVQLPIVHDYAPGEADAAGSVAVL
jgi:Icc-related predicted phosphoesterase